MGELLGLGNAKNNRPEGMDLNLSKIYDKLEMWYPEHKAFAMDSIDKSLREMCSKLAKEQGITVEELLNSIGFELINGDDVYELRGPTRCEPGSEPSVIKNKLDSVLQRLEKAYPDKVIKGSVQNNHKRLSQDISGVLQWLGYKSPEEFLTAYGYEYIKTQKTNKGGRPTGDYSIVIDALKAKYSDGPVHKGIKGIIEDFPEYNGKLKTMANSAKELYGTTLKDYFIQQGILKDASSERQNAREAEAEQRRLEKQNKLDAKKAEQDKIEAAKKAIEDFEKAITDELLFNCGIEFRDAAFVITDPDDEMDYYRILQTIEERGGFHRNAVSGKTRFLIAPQRCNTMNYMEALRYQSEGTNIKILTEEEFFEATEKYDAYVASTDILERKTTSFDAELLAVIPGKQKFIIEDKKLVEYVGTDERVDIPNGIEVIGSNAFACTVVTNITMPESVILIEKNAFSGCKHLANIKLSANIEKIEEGAFEFCKKLTQVVLKKTDKISTLGNRAFAHCYSLKQVNIEASVTLIGEDCFEKCVKLEKVVLPETLECISANTFKDCISLKCDEISVLPKNVDESAFINCMAQSSGVPVEENEVVENGTKKSKKDKVSNDELSLATQLARTVSEPVTQLVFEGKIFVHTTCVNESKIDRLVANRGGEVKSSTVLKTDYIIIGDSIDHETTKISKALELNGRGKSIQAMTESEFWMLAKADEDN